MTDKIEQQIESLRKNILFNWPHLSHYGDEMHQAADSLQALLDVAKAAEKDIEARTSVNVDHRLDAWKELIEALAKLDEL